jgi:uncharacterized phage-like protein YoqJ
MDQQLQIKQNIPPLLKKTCSFTGHRVLEENFSPKKLKKIIKTLLEQGISIFYNGMAFGFDMTAAEILLTFRKKYDFKLIACIPCLDQEKFYSYEYKQKYYQLLEQADEKIVFSESYFKGCMQIRDKYLAKQADVLVAYCNKDTGGTAYTVKCFQRMHPDKEIYFI